MHDFCFLCWFFPLKFASSTRTNMPAELLLRSLYSLSIDGQKVQNTLRLFTGQFSLRVRIDANHCKMDESVAYVLLHLKHHWRKYPLVPKLLRLPWRLGHPYPCACWHRSKMHVRQQPIQSRRMRTKIHSLAGRTELVHWKFPDRYLQSFEEWKWLEERLEAYSYCICSGRNNFNPSTYLPEQGFQNYSL